MLLIHVAISILGIFAGYLVMFGMILNRPSDRVTALFLHSTTLTSLTGFLLPADRFLPSHAFGIISLIALGVAYAALYRNKLHGRARALFIVSAMLAQFLNVFVAIVQIFQKVPAFHVLAPTQSELPFFLAQALSLLFILWVSRIALQKYAVRAVS